MISKGKDEGDEGKRKAMDKEGRGDWIEGLGNGIDRGLCLERY